MPDTWQTVEQAAVSLGLSVRTVNRHVAAGKLASRLTDGRREVLIALPEPEPDALRMSVRDAFHRLNASATIEPEPEPIVFDDVPFDDHVGFEAPYGELDPEPQPDPEPAYQPAPPPAYAPSPESTYASAPQPVQVPPSQQESAGHYVGSVHDGRVSAASDNSRGFDSNTILALADNASDKAELAVTAYQALARQADLRVEATRRSARFAWGAVAAMAAGVTLAVGWTTHHLTRAKFEAESLRHQVTTTSATIESVSKERDTLRSELTVARERAARSEGQLDAATQAQARIEADEKDKQSRRAADKPTFFDRLTSIWDDR